MSKQCRINRLALCGIHANTCRDLLASTRVLSSYALQIPDNVSQNVVISLYIALVMLEHSCTELNDSAEQLLMPYIDLLSL